VRNERDEAVEVISPKIRVLPGHQYAMTAFIRISDAAGCHMVAWYLNQKGRTIKYSMAGGLPLPEKQPSLDNVGGYPYDVYDVSLLKPRNPD